MIILLLATLVMPATSADPFETGGDRPNLVLFLVDDLGWQDVSVPFHTKPTPFNERYQTTNLERLAKRGMKFTHAYASAPVCTPTRTSIMTGMSPARSHITYWTLHRDRDTSSKHETLLPPKWKVNALQEGDVTLPALLSEAGYRTIHVGKAHFGARETSGADPTRLGFDHNVAGHAPGAPGSYLGTDNFSADKRRGSNVWDVPGLEEYHGKDIFLTEAITEKAIRKVEDAVKADEPFFLYFAPYAVHTPIMANKDLLEPYEDLHPREAAYSTMVESMDRALGAILEKLEKLGVRENTIIIFTSDNGGLSAHARGGEAHTHNAPLRSGKGSAYEGGIRVPFVISWPGVTESASINKTPVISHDLFPTYLKLAGIEIPATHEPLVDGEDLTPLFRSQKGAFPSSRELVWHMPHFWGPRGPGIEPFSAIRKDDWKLLYFHDGGRFELYDVSRDVSEGRNLAKQKREIVRDLAGTLGKALATRGAQMSIHKEDGVPVALPSQAVKSGH